MQHFIKNPYPPPKPPEHEKIIKLKPTWENQPKKIIKPPTQKNVKPRNLQPRTWTSFFMFFSKSRQTQLTNPLKINLDAKNPYPQTETTTNNQNNHHNHPHHNNHKSPPKTHHLSTLHHPPSRVKPKLKQNLRPILKLKTPKQNPNSNPKPKPFAATTTTTTTINIHHCQIHTHKPK